MGIVSVLFSGGRIWHYGHISLHTAHKLIHFHVMQNQDQLLLLTTPASSYDKRMAKSAPLANALAYPPGVFELPADARILCTYVKPAQNWLPSPAFPQWRFIAVEPATPMLEICRARKSRSVWYPHHVALFTKVISIHSRNRISFARCGNLPSVSFPDVWIWFRSSVHSIDK